MNNEEKKLEVTTKQKVGVGTQIGIGIAVLAVIAAGAGLAGFFMVKGTGGGVSETTVTKTAVTPAAPGAFNLSLPANGATDQDDDVTLSWTPSTGANYYDVYLGAGSVGTNPIAKVTPPINTGMAVTYLAEDLTVDTTYYWNIKASNNNGSRWSSNGPFTLTTAGPTWIRAQGYTPVDPLIAAACGANRECDNDDYLSCLELNGVWLTCSGTSNRCPDNQSEQCLQMTICQCSGVAPGSPDCTTFLATWIDPCL